MDKQETFFNKLFEKELVDENKLAVVASAKKLPNGEWGMCLLCLNKSILTVCNTNMQQNIGHKLYQIDLVKISNYKYSTFIFNPYIKFIYNNYQYKFVNFGNAKNFVSALNCQIKK